MMNFKFGANIILALILSNLLSARTVVVKEHNDKVLLWMEAEAGDINDPIVRFANSPNRSKSDEVVTFDAINTCYGRGDIPIGFYKNTLSDLDPSVYLDAQAGIKSRFCMV